jgi:hypothetical protein
VRAGKSITTLAAATACGVVRPRRRPRKVSGTTVSRPTRMLTWIAAA